MRHVEEAGVLPPDVELVLAVPVTVRGGRVTIRRLLLPTIGVVLMVAGYVIGGRVGESDPRLGIVLLAGGLVAGTIAILWLLVDGIRDVRRVVTTVGTAAMLVDLRSPATLCLTDGRLWSVHGRGGAMTLAGSVPADEVARFTIGIGAAPTLDVSFVDGSHLALRAGVVDHGHWMRSAAREWIDATADAHAARSEREAAERDQPSA